VATNGALIDSKMARELKAAGVERVAISLDGPTPEVHDGFRGTPGSYQQAIDAYEFLQRREVPLQFTATLGRHNADHLEELLDLAERREAHALHLWPLVAGGCGAGLGGQHHLTADCYREALTAVRERAAQSPVRIRMMCEPPEEPAEIAGAPAESPAGLDACFVSHRGEVQPCGHLPLVAGDARQRTLRSIWEGSELLASLRRAPRTVARCGACEVPGLCPTCRGRVRCHGSEAVSG
jgi:radical SAM protein with 4Fe4S-binding SPASM domain